MVGGWSGETRRVDRGTVWDHRRGIGLVTDLYRTCIGVIGHNSLKMSILCLSILLRKDGVATEDTE